MCNNLDKHNKEKMSEYPSKMIESDIKESHPRGLSANRLSKYFQDNRDNEPLDN